jgi:toxin ParE1/3/4
LIYRKFGIILIKSGLKINPTNIIFELIEDCLELSENQNLGQNYIEIDLEIYGYKSGQHIIFYRSLNEKEIEIIRFLHSRMDLKNRIQE